MTRDGWKLMCPSAAAGNAFERLGLDQAVVLIDMPELMLHPEDHVRVVDALAGMLTAGQLIIATTSPAILRAVPASRVWSLGR